MDCSDLFGRTACCFGICGAAQAMQTAMEEALGWFFQLKCGVFPDFENIRCVQILRFFEDLEIQKWRNFMKAPGSECPGCKACFRSDQYATAWPPRYHQCCWLKSGSTSWKCRLAKKRGNIILFESWVDSGVSAIVFLAVAVFSVGKTGQKSPQWSVEILVVETYSSTSKLMSGRRTR